MTKVSDNLRLERRNGVYYYHRRVPDFAVSAMGRETTKYSLKTHDKKQACKLLEIEDLKWSAKFGAIEDSGSATLATASPSSPEDVIDTIRAYVRQTDRNIRQLKAAKYWRCSPSPS